MPAGLELCPRTQPSGKTGAQGVNKWSFSEQGFLMVLQGTMGF